MKLQKRPKGTFEIKRDGVWTKRAGHGNPRKAPEKPKKVKPEPELNLTSYLEDMERRNAERQAAMTTSPLTANEAGLGYSGPEMPDKGQKNGSCNRSACQMPLAGKPQYFMDGRPWGNNGSRLYYCAPCAKEFTRWDLIDRPGEGLRCAPDEDNDKLAA